MLSQNTSDANSFRAYESLRARFPTWERLAAARPSEVAAAIRSGGLSNVKAPRILAILRAIEEREGDLDLSFLRRMSDAEARDYLMSLPGVGPKTAAVVLAFSLDRPAFPVDTHVHRVAGRLGLIPPKTSPANAHDILEAITPPEIRVAMHVGLIRLGTGDLQARPAEVRGLPPRGHLPHRADDPGDQREEGVNRFDGWSGRGESDPRLELGKLAFCH